MTDLRAPSPDETPLSREEIERGILDHVIDPDGPRARRAVEVLVVSRVRVDVFDFDEFT